MPPTPSLRAYFDWAATSPLREEAREAALRAMAQLGNPSSVHAEGRGARALVEGAREQVARLVGCESGEVIFTSSGSEANALAVLGQRGEGPLAYGAMEHASLRLAVQAAGRRGRGAVELPATAAGVLDLERARVLLGGGAALVAAQLVNNETGVIQPVEALAALAAEAGAHFHCDAVQAAGKLALEPVWTRCHSMALSAHKLGGLPGVGALILRRGIELDPLVPGHQERGRRGGTASLPGIVAFGAVAASALLEREERLGALRGRSAELEGILREAWPSLRLQGKGAARVPGIVSATFPGVDGELLLVALDLAGIACSHGAACSTGALEPSHVLLAMGLEEEDARSTLRFSLGPESEVAELERLRAALPSALRTAAVAT